VLAELQREHATKEEGFNSQTTSLQNSHNGSLASLKEEQNSQNS
jgi:hypothetical protein